MAGLTASYINNKLSAEGTINKTKGRGKQAAPFISLSKDGGVIQGIGEKFAANVGNGPLGSEWNFSMPGSTRGTEKKLSQFREKI